MIDKIKYKYMNKKELNAELLDACAKGHLDIVKYLLTSPELTEHKNIHYKDTGGWDALMVACYYGNLTIVKYLLTSSELKENVNIHDKNNYGSNALISSCVNEHLDIVEYLVIDMNMIIDKETMNWLQGDNDKDIVYQDTLKLIESRDLHQKLDESISSDKINNNKVKGIKL